MTLTRQPSTADSSEDALAGLYRQAMAADDLVAADETELAELARAHRALAELRPSGQCVLRVFDRTMSRHGRATAVTVVQVVTDDMPCLVDSVLEELAHSGFQARRVLHPIVVVKRDDEGVLTGLLDGADPEHAPADAIVESWISVEFDRITDATRADEMGSRLHAVLDDVREVAAAGSQLREVALAVAAAVPDPETAALLRWLAEGNFLFLGYRFDEISAAGGGRDPGLGLLRGDSSLIAGLDTVAPGSAPDPLELSPASGRSTVHGPDSPFYVGVRTFSPGGEVTGEHRFIGAFTGSAQHADVSAIPVLATRVRRAIHQAGVPLRSHSGRQMLNVLQDFPLTELFSADWEFLIRSVTGVLASAERPRLQLFLRRDPHQRFFSCVLHVARDRYTTASRLAMEEILLAELRGQSVDHHLRATDAALATVQFIVHTLPGVAVEPDLGVLHDRLSATVRSWDDRFVEAAVAERKKPEITAEAGRRCASAFSQAYKEDFDAETALHDLRRLQTLSSGGDPAPSVYLPSDAGAGEARFKLYLSGRRITLSAVLPVLQQIGVQVVDERPYEITWDGVRHWIYDFGLALEGDGDWTDPATRGRFEDAFAAVWRGDAESDRFNGLVLRAGINWQQAALLRAYAKYLRQTGTTYSQSYLRETLLAHPETAVALVRLFETRFDLDLAEPDRAGKANGIRAEIERLVDEVASLDEDRILRGWLDLIQATVRTNYHCFAGETNGGSADRVLVLKLDPSAVPGLPAPRPNRETFVYSPRVEGVHLRYGPVGRGGLRWSDRREDYRTEILGLVKAQAAKNAVIVPVGAKGGFVLKRPPSGDRDALAAEALTCYQMFIGGLLDVTDNLVGGRVVPAPRVVRHDEDDTYLVVAADKGTATFSDAANEVALARRFWLGDAFASGGSVGYDHKAMGITARGAWTSVERHFHELGLNPRQEDFSVVGVGDMSGDVFGNGMLLSRHIRLVAAFDHRHVFVDPDPDPRVSFAERQRLFQLPRSSWADYDPDLIRPGGGVWPRDAKAIPVTQRMRAALGLARTVDLLSPNELIKAILLAPVDLLWSGGIGTYVKAAVETHADVRDKANDAVRVNGDDLRVRVVAEGGNLGLTQQGRIEFARAGGKVNTDALDNSAGVDCSDHEVNIKIMLDLLVAKAALSPAERNGRLAELTDEVADLVLANNRRQNRVLGVSRAHAAAMLPVHGRLIADLERRHGLDRQLESLPARRQLTTLERDGHGLTSPELATLLAHVKLGLKKEILAGDLLDERAFAQRAADYFPEPLRKPFGSAIDRHPLRREIETTLLVNEVVDNGGLSYAFRLAEELSVPTADAVRAFTVVTEVYDLHSLWHWLDTAGSELPAGVTDGLFLETRRLLDRASRWMLAHRPDLVGNVDAEIERFRPVVRRLTPDVPELLQQRQRAAAEQEVRRLMDDQVPEAVAWRITCLLDTYPLLDVAEVAGVVGEGSEHRTAQAHYALSEHLGVDRLLAAVNALERGDRWHALARLALRDDLYDSLRAITLQALRTGDGEQHVERTIAVWEDTHRSRLARVRLALGEFGDSGRLDLPALTVAVNQIRALAG
ncbi:NAD-glutamate dehydrogenase [Amycolatopsis acidicola]|uniref:NAD-glutamate dehydrogenase n=1 Tax=Amycolatopsis acidicola TaxID=2596893 RepID=A0A5N0V4G6_9PSEU|nr:NAD-glutamate dehydrogenase [Amycolatopsis acidicola]KAA9161317.1 NAD-glutamate dehydrogenase [Amycolatopsis acidicola]